PIFTPLPTPPPIILPRTRASMVLMRSSAPSTFILAPLSRTPPIGTPPLLPIPLPTSSFPLPLFLPSISYREGIPEADMPLRKKARFTTPTGGYEVGESSVAAARQIRPTLTVDDSRRAEDRLIGRLRRERRYFHTFTLVTQIKTLQRDVSTLQGQQIDDGDRLTRHIQHEHAQRDAAPEDGDKVLAEYETQRNSVVNEDTSHTTGTGPRTVRPTRECIYKDYLNCWPLKFNGTEGVIGLTRWFERTESVSSISNCTAENQVNQGDPLSPFLFILIMESLHLSFQRVVDAGIYKSIKLSSSLSISHMFYVDDAIFVGQWCDGNITTLVHVLECFYRASGLRINMNKSKIMGVLVDSDKVKCAASKLGCLILKTLFSYLG
nr:RNA-directed DNA polymerase, eukaryota, reverse transcriptase zinc-binding domain protein [Tanacetum cinerariifolium]